MPVRKILIADDSSTARHVLFQMLARHGYRCVLAETAKEAMDKAKSEKPDLILMDEVTRDLAAVPFAGSSRRGRPRAVCSLSAAGTELRRRVLHSRNVARPRVHLRGRGDGRAGHGGTDFGTRRGAGIGGAPPVGTAVPARIRAFDALHLRTRIGAVHFRPVQRAVARCRGRILPPEIAPLAGLGAGAETLLQRRDVIRHAPTMPGIVLPDDRLPGSHEPRPVDDTRAIHEDVGDIHDGDVARPPVAGAEEKSRAHDDAGTPGESRGVPRIRVVAGPGGPIRGRIPRAPPRSV